MTTEAKTAANIEQAVPFFMVTDMERALKFYVDGLGCAIKMTWTPHGKIEWCWLKLGEAALMLQEYRADRVPAAKRGEGVSICFMCKDALALYREFKARGVQAKRPFVGNGLWVTSLTDPDGYRIDFESPTDAPEESVYTDPEN
jgi:predicted enzyme related to lactoylglutathione lyase